MDLLKIGAHVKQSRRGRRWSQSELAKRSGVSLARIDALENHRATDIGFKNVMRILHALDLDLRLTTFNASRPTLEDLMTEDETRE